MSWHILFECLFTNKLWKTEAEATGITLLQGSYTAAKTKKELMAFKNQRMRKYEEEENYQTQTGVGFVFLVFFTNTEQHTPVLWRALGFQHSLWRGTCLWNEWGRWEQIWNRQACTRSTCRSPRTPSSQTGISWRWAQGWAQRRLCWSGQSDWKDNNDDDKKRKTRHMLVKVVIKNKKKAAISVKRYQ